MFLKHLLHKRYSLLIAALKDRFFYSLKGRDNYADSCATTSTIYSTHYERIDTYENR